MKRKTKERLLLGLGIIALTFIVSFVHAFEAPQLLSPISSEIVVIGPITFSWTAVPDARFYILSSCWDPNLSEFYWSLLTLYQPSYIYSTSWTLTEDDQTYLQDVAVYGSHQDTFYWKVVAYCGDQLSMSPWSQIWHFNVLKSPAAWIDSDYWNGVTETDNPTLWAAMGSLPLGEWRYHECGDWYSRDIAVTTLPSVLLIWSDYPDDFQQKPVKFADQYRIQISNSSAFDSLVVDATTGNNSYTTPVLSPGVYYWRARSELADGSLVTQWNAPRKFVILSSASQQATLTITAEDGGNTSLAPGTYTYDYGANVTVTATANAGFEFLNWFLNGNDVGSQNPITVKMDASHTLQPIFVPVQDRTPPTVQITLPGPNWEIRSSVVTVTWTGSDETSGISIYEVRLDGGSWINVGTSTTHTFSGLGDGSHIVDVKAADKAGNTKQTIVIFTVNTSLIGEPGWIDDIIAFSALVILMLVVVVYLVKIRKR